MDIKGARIVVTGGAAGLGFAIASALRDKGAVPVLIDRDNAALDQALAALSCAGYVADIAKPDQVEAVIAAVCADGVPHALINNAGIIRSAPLLNLLNPDERRHPLALWQEVIDVNLTSVFLMTRAMAMRMAEKRVRGVIVSMSSIAARGNAGQGAYAAAKAGVEALTHTWARELGPLGLRFVAIAPGFIDTPSTRTALDEHALSEWKRRTPLHRLGQASEIALAVVYALENDMLTGTVLQVDGGLTL